MITLAGGAVLACCAIGLGVWRLRKRQSESSSDPAAPPLKSPTPSPLLQLGEVLLIQNESLWLTAQLSLQEEHFEASLLRVEEEEPARWVYQDHAAPEQIALLAPHEDLPLGPAPHEFPVGLRRLRLERQGSVSIKMRGTIPPGIQAHASFWIMSEVGGMLALKLDRSDRAPLRLLGQRSALEGLSRLPGPTTPD